MPTPRQALADRLKQVLKAREAHTLSTVRLMLAAPRGRDVAPADKATSRHGGVFDCRTRPSDCKTPRGLRPASRLERLVADSGKRR
jgi:hypothetical protein